MTYDNYSGTQLKDTSKPVKIKTSFFETVRRGFKDISYEPVLVLYQTCFMVTTLSSANLMLEKACRVDLNLSEEVCSSLRMQNETVKYQHQEEILQKYVAPSINLRTYIVIGIPCLILPFVGSFSDRTGYRKIVATILITVQIIVSVHNIMQVHFMTETGLYFFAALEALIEALGGGFSFLLLTAFSHVAEVTSVRDRTFRLGMLYFSFSVSFPIGLAIGGPLLKHYGYYWCYGFSACMSSVNLTYILLRIKDTRRNAVLNQRGQGFFYFICTFFDPSNIKDTIRVTFKNGPDKRRLRIIILLSILSIVFGPVFGEQAIMYMFTRYRFGWDELKYSMYQTYNSVAHTLGAVPLIILSKALRWHDSVLGIIATLSKIAGAFVFCFAPTERWFYLAPLVEMLNGTGLLAIRSIVSKMVAPDELGKVNSLIGLTENLIPLIYVPLYTTVYTATMAVLPGAVFLVAAAMTIPAVAAFFWLFYENKKGVKPLKEEEAVKEATVPLNSPEENSVY